MIIETKYNIGGKVKFRNPVPFLSDVLVGTIIQVDVTCSKRSTTITYYVDKCRDINGHKTSVDLRMVDEENILGIMEE